MGISHCTIKTSVSRPIGTPYSLEVKWTPYKGWTDLQYYEVYRATSGGGFKLLRTCKASELSMLDTLLCDKPYCYYVVAVSKAGLRSRSNDACGTPWYGNPVYQVPLQLATVEQSKYALLKWEFGPEYYSGVTYLISRQQGANWVEIGKTRLNYFADLSAAVNKQTWRYSIAYGDHCGGISGQGPHATTIFAGGRMDQDVAVLSWTPYEQWPEGISEYQVQRKDLNGVFRTLGTCAATTLDWKDLQALSIANDTLCYRILAIRAAGRSDTSVSNYVKLVPQSRMFVPNAFTPNGDGRNDRFQATSLYIVKEQLDPAKQFELNIYTRWGELVFKGNRPEDAWDGTYKGTLCPEGIYVYQIKGVGYDGKLFVFNGNLSLMR